MDKKRELFKRYLDEKHVNDYLSRIVVSLYETGEKPSDPLQYIQDYLANVENVDMSVIRLENEKMSKEIIEKRAKLDELQKRIEEREKSQ